MEPDRRSVYPAWDLAMPARRARSALYPLPPRGVGTPDVESLTSYLARLAAAHSVSPRVLLVEAVIPLVGRSDLRKETDNSLSAFWMNDSRTLNGTGTIARGWSRALATLTGRAELAHLTLLTWREVLPSRGLLRRGRAWCPACYEGWRAQGMVVYDPLRWALTSVTGCPRHRRRLRQTCPHPGCGRSLPLLASQSRPGHCSACGGWLGAAADSEASGEALGAEVGAWQSWVNEAVGDLLVASPVATPPRRNRIAQFITECVELAGGLTAFAQTMGLRLGTVCQWRLGAQLPSVGALVALCYRLDLSLRDVLLADPARFSPTPIRPPPPSDAPVAPAAPRKRFETDRLRATLEDILQRSEQPPPSMRKVARRVGVAHADLHRRFPDLCRAISARFLAHCRSVGEQRRQRLCREVREATFQVHAQGLYPSSVRVAGRLAHAGHFRHPMANAAWHTALRELGWEG